MPDVGHYRMKGLAALRHCAVYRTRFFGHKFELSGLLHAGVLPSEPRLARAA
jgi:hypothetical protein